MKIAVVSPNTPSLQEIQRLLGTDGKNRSVTLYEGGPGQVRVVADQHSPNLIIIDSMCRDLDDLHVLEYVSIHHPNTALVMLCANQTPEFLVTAMRAGVREVLQSPPPRDVLRACVDRIEQRLGLAVQPKQPARILAFVPCKGGSGATFLATNLGYQLASENKKVLLIDLNLQFGEAVLTVHDRKATSDIAEVARNLPRLDASYLGASVVQVTTNFEILPAPEDPAQSMQVKPEHLDAILNVAVNQYDFIILDLSKTVDDLSIKALDRAHNIFLVMQTMLPHIRNAGRMMTMFRSLGYSQDKVELIVNRYWKNGEIGLDDIRASLGITKMRTIPNGYKEVARAVNQGQPLARVAKSSFVLKAIGELAQSLLPKPDQAQSGLFGRLLKH